jgi:hypothetical protein
MFYIYDTITRLIVYGNESLTRTTWMQEQNWKEDHKIIESTTKIPLRTSGKWIVNDDNQVENIDIN